jgi:RNA polymerase sigma factor (sigma-70 family)
MAAEGCNSRGERRIVKDSPWAGPPRPVLGKAAGSQSQAAHESRSIHGALELQEVQREMSRFFDDEGSEFDGIFGKPGRDWTSEEQAVVCKWALAGPGRALRKMARTKWHWVPVEEAESLVGFALCLAIRGYDPSKRPHIPGKILFYGYLTTTFRNLCLNFPRHKELELDFDPIFRDSGADLDRVELAETIKHCIEAIEKPEHREVFMLVDIELLSYKETAEQMACSIGTVRGWLHRARHQVRDCLKNKGVL